MSELTNLEVLVLEKFLSGNDKTLETLRKQIPGLVAVSREMTGVGFYTRFGPPRESLRVNGSPSFTLSDVFGQITELQHGASFALWVKEGLLHMVEGTTYDEAWPNEISQIELHYVEEPRTERVRRAIEQVARD